MGNHYEAWDKLEEPTLENVLLNWLTDDMGCIVSRIQHREGHFNIFMNGVSSRIKLEIKDEMIHLTCKNTRILTASMYDPDRFEEIKVTIEECIARLDGVGNRCTGCRFDWTDRLSQAVDTD